MTNDQKTPKKASKKTANKKEQVAEAPPAVAWDHDTKLVYGTISKLTDGKLVIKATDGSTHECAVAGRTVMRHGLIQWVGADNKLIKHYLGRGRGHLAKLTQDDPRVFRIADAKKSGGVLFGVTGPTYRPFQVEDVVEKVREVMPKGSTIRMHPSNGKHGGTIEANLGEHAGLIRLGLVIDGGSKNGREAASIRTVGTILACKNQLTMEVAALFEKLKVEPTVGATMGSRNRHTKTPIATLIESAGALGGQTKDIVSLIEKTKSVKLTERQMDDVLFYYMACGRISRKTVEMVREALKDSKVQQVPGTLYGLAMAVTWVGTHDKEAQVGVRASLQRMGGELLVVAPVVRPYLKMVAENQPPEEAKLPQVEVKAVPKKQKVSASAANSDSASSPKPTRSRKPAPGHVAVTDRKTGKKSLVALETELSEAVSDPDTVPETSSGTSETSENQ